MQDCIKNCIDDCIKDFIQYHPIEGSCPHPHNSQSGAIWLIRLGCSKYASDHSTQQPWASATLQPTGLVELGLHFDHIWAKAGDKSLAAMHLLCSTLHIEEFREQTVNCTMASAQYPQNILHFRKQTAHCIPHTAQYAQNTEYFWKQTAYFILHTAQYAQSTAHWKLHTEHQSFSIVYLSD